MDIAVEPVWGVRRVLTHLVSPPRTSAALLSCLPPPTPLSDLFVCCCFYFSDWINISRNYQVEGEKYWMIGEGMTVVRTTGCPHRSEGVRRVLTHLVALPRALGFLLLV